MKETIANKSYIKLLTDISILYEHARSTTVKTYLEIGRHIIEVEQDRSIKSEYGSNLLQRLSADLTKKYGKGFSISNLKNMRKFYLVTPKSQTSGFLDWSKHVLLISIKDEKIRLAIEKRAVKENLTYLELKRIVTNENRKAKMMDGDQAHRLKISRGELYTYRIINNPIIKCPSLVIKTYKADKYARYLSDIFYLPEQGDLEIIASEEIFLNQELLDKGLAVKY